MCIVTQYQFHLKATIMIKDNMKRTVTGSSSLSVAVMTAFFLSGGLVQANATPTDHGAPFVASLQ